MPKRAKRLVKVAKQFDLSRGVIIKFLLTKGISVNNKPTTKISNHMYDLLLTEFGIPNNTVIKNKSKVKSKRKNKAVHPANSLVKSTTNKNSIFEAKDVSPKTHTSKANQNSLISKNDTTKNSVHSKNSKLSDKQSQLNQSNTTDYPDKMVDLAKKHIVGKRIYQIAQMVKISPKTLIRNLGLRKSPTVFNFRISEKTWNSNMPFFLSLYYNNEKAASSKSSKFSHNNKRRKNKPLAINKSGYTGPQIKYKKNKIGNKFKKMTLEEKRRYESKREFIKRKNNSKESGKGRIIREPRIIYIGHPRY